MRITSFSAQGAQEIEPNALAAALASDTKAIWVDMTGPTQQDIQTMREVFKFHPLAIEDTQNQRQRPKIEEYPGNLFAILNAVRLEGDAVIFREIDVFIGHNFMVTIHLEHEPLMDEISKRISRVNATPLMSPGYLLYLVMDTVVDCYFPVLDTLGEEIDSMEETILDKPQREALNRLFTLKRMLSEVWRVLGQQRDMFNVLYHRDLDYIDHQALEYYLRDVYDHLLRSTDVVNTYRDVLTSMIELYVSSVSNRLNEVVTRLTIVTVITGPLAVITGFYGMNFEKTWPPFTAPWGVPFVIVLMLVIAGGAALVLRLLRWI
ncbi:MAG: magnesium/cobalt transporter CorA [Anaerolineae bacterium]|nr:magnesium/cobalt transporter CorA [Anaerolineae bacterium]